MKRLHRMTTAVVLLALPAFAWGATLGEIRIDQAGEDLDEYVELAGAPGESLDGLTLLVIGDGAVGNGSLDAVVDLSGYAIQADGVFCLAEATFTLSCGVADAIGTLNFENSDNLTFLLVTGFTGTSADDLDADDDWTLDYTPWASVVDEVAFVETVDTGDAYYSAVTVGPDGTYVPGHAAFCGGSWHVLDFDICLEFESPGHPADAECRPVPNDAMSWGGMKSLYR